MEYTFNQFIAIGAALTLCALAVCFMYADAVSRVTEALLDAVEFRLARRAQRRQPHTGNEIHQTLFTHQ
ncbi:MAG TPA: hypothetical protein VFS10_06065 [Pyrinomonadaceae bacterium]|nr:hypothetical protein [Pyrinomonadaceae bacterium]